MWTKRKGLSVVIKILSPNGLSAPARGYIHMVKHEKSVSKIGLQSNFFLLNLQQIGKSDKGFLPTSKVCPQGGCLPLPRGYIHIYNH